MSDERRIRMPAKEQCEAVKEEVQNILDIIADVADNPNIRDALVTPRSCIGDFFYLDPWDEVKDELAARLGLPVQPHDNLIALARRMKAV